MTPLENAQPALDIASKIEKLGGAKAAVVDAFATALMRYGVQAGSALDAAKVRVGDLVDEFLAGRRKQLVSDLAALGFDPPKGTNGGRGG